jgi:hypothetical protein
VAPGIGHADCLGFGNMTYHDKPSQWPLPLSLHLNIFKCDEAPRRAVSVCLVKIGILFSHCRGDDLGKCFRAVDRAVGNVYQGGRNEYV